MSRKQNPLIIAAGAALLACAAAFAVPGERPAAQDDEQALSGVLVEVTRGPLVESRHYGRFVAVTPGGEIRRSVGDPSALVLSRSALKPLQAIGTVRLALERGVELTPEEIAVMCASHGAQPYHIEAVTALLQRAETTSEQLHCGVVRGDRINHNCSGKHGGMLVQARLAEAPLDNYWDTEHPVQRSIQRSIQEFTGYSQPLQWGADGCGAPNYALPLSAIALGFARIANPESAPPEYQQAAAAMRAAILAHPGHLSTNTSFHARMIEASEGRIVAKTGAEACYGMGISQPGLGIAVKIEDGSSRGMQPVLLAALDRLGAMTPELERRIGGNRTSAIRNSRGDTVGEIRAAEW